LLLLLLLLLAELQCFQLCKRFVRCRMFIDERNKVLRGNARCHGDDVVDDVPGSEITATGFRSRAATILSPVER